MKKFLSEFGHNYRRYSFGYANYCMSSPTDNLCDIYAQGYLPYSGGPGAVRTFYMARSSRIYLPDFATTSENRRVANKFDKILTRQSTPLRQFDTDDKNFLTFCTNYFHQRHGPFVMPLARLETVLRARLITNIVSYLHKGAVAAYVFEVSDKYMTHFWFSFYDLSFVHQSLGMWLMLDSARHALKRSNDYFYLGTVYGEKALYKTAFKNLQYWDGSRWICDVKQLRALARSDDKRSVHVTDMWSENQPSF